MGRKQCKETQMAVEDQPKRFAPSTTPEGREQQLIAMAVDLAEKQLREGTASAQVITHYLKLSSTRERLEKEKLERENELLRAKTDMIRDSKHTEELYRDAIDAMLLYTGRSKPEDGE